jgi:membrane protein involved in colicin uptake
MAAFLVARDAQKDAADRVAADKKKQAEADAKAASEAAYQEVGDAPEVV